MANEKPADLDMLVIPSSDRSWAVLHSRPRCEKKVQEFCRANDVPAYLPLQRKTHQYGGRKREFWSPLFPGYVFCICDQPQRTLLRQNRYIANYLDVVDQAGLVAQLRNIAVALGAGNVLEVMPYLREGNRVAVKDGPFKGFEGIVLRVKGQTRIVLNVDMIMQSVAVEVDSSILSPL